MVVEAPPKSFNFSFKKLSSSIFKFFLQILLPARCLSCRSVLPEPHRLCAACWQALEFIEEPCCIRCGFPFDVEIETAVQCGLCTQKRPAFDRCWSIFVYNEASKRLILQFKHADRLEAIPLFVQFMEKAAHSLCANVDLIIPVPLHWTRLWRRQYNQAALLACALGKRVKIPVALTVLKRHRRTPSQGILAAQQRVKNMKGAFSIAKGYRANLNSKTILLIDDVYTTGATLNACASTLKKAGVREVIVLTLARALKGR